MLKSHGSHGMMCCNFLKLMSNKVIQRSYNYFLKNSYFNFSGSSVGNDHLTITILYYTSKLLPYSYIAKQFIWNVLLYKLVTTLLQVTKLQLFHLNEMWLEATPPACCLFLLTSCPTYSTKKLYTVATNPRQQPHFTHSPCLTSLLIAILCHREGTFTQNVEHLQNHTPQPLDDHEQES
jgi:hypothetical protein